jgi:hypothetical protein
MTGPDNERAAADVARLSAERAAERAYERGRMKRALPFAIAPLLIAGIAIAGGADPAMATPWLLSLAIAVVFFAWRGRALQRAIAPGLLVGATPLIPVAFSQTHMCTGSVCLSLCGPLCLIGGAAAGIWAGRRIALASGERTTVLLGVVALVALTAPLSCLPLGIGGLSGLAVGLAVGGVPSFVYARLT